MTDAAEVVALMQAKAGTLQRLGYRVRLDLTDTAESILLDATGSQPEITTVDAATDADTVLRITGADLDKLIAGRLSPMLAFATGRLKVEGSKGVAMKLAGLLDEE